MSKVLTEEWKIFFFVVLFSVGNILFFFKTVESYTKLNALNPTFNFLLRKFTLNSLLGKNSVFQNRFIGNKASEINKNFFLFVFVEIMFAFSLHLLIENFKSEDYYFEIIWCLMSEWIWKDLVFKCLRFWDICNHVPQQEWP